MRAIMDGYLNSVTVGEGKPVGSMTLFPLSRKGASPLRFKVLAEALQDGSVVVTEKPLASVPELWLANRSDSMVLDGEEMVGGLQNRVVNASFLILELHQRGRAVGEERPPG